LKHHFGRRNADRTLADNPVWEWTRDPAGDSQKRGGAAVLYGPYSTDFPEPGTYSAVFRIRGVSFAKPGEIVNDLVLLELDVAQTVQLFENGKYVPKVEPIPHDRPHQRDVGGAAKDRGRECGCG
jgi:hypothetical protein